MDGVQDEDPDLGALGVIRFDPDDGHLIPPPEARRVNLPAPAGPVPLFEFGGGRLKQPPQDIPAFVRAGLAFPFLGRGRLEQPPQDIPAFVQAGDTFEFNRLCPLPPPFVWEEDFTTFPIDWDKRTPVTKAYVCDVGPTLEVGDEPRGRTQSELEPFFRLTTFPDRRGIIVTVYPDQEFYRGTTRRSEARAHAGISVTARNYRRDPANEIRYYALSIHIPSDWKDVNGKMVLWQIHQANTDDRRDDWPPPLWIDISNQGVPDVEEPGQRAQRVRLIQHHLQEQEGEEDAASDPVYLKHWLLDEWRGKERRFVLKTNWQVTDGLLRLWLDGKKEVEDSRPQGYGYGTQATVFGIYAVAWSKGRDIPNDETPRSVTYRNSLIGNGDHLPCHFDNRITDTE